MVSSSKAAAASAVSSGVMAPQGSFGSSTGIRFTPIDAACPVSPARNCGRSHGVRAPARMAVFCSSRFFFSSAVSFAGGCSRAVPRCGRIKLALQVADAQLPSSRSPDPSERRLDTRTYPSRPARGSPREPRAVFRGASDGAELIHSPAEGHGAGARYKTKRRPQTRIAASRGRRGDGAERLRPEREADTTRGDSARRSSRRPARPLSQVPRIARAAAEPLVSHGQRAECELGRQHGSGGVETLNDGCIFVEGLMLETSRPPCRRITSLHPIIFAPEGMPWRGATIFADGDFGVCCFGLCERAVFS